MGTVTPLKRGSRPLPAPPPDAGAMLAEIVPELIAAEQTVAALRGHVDAWARRLAESRGIGFIRHERIRQEFAPPTEGAGQ